MKAEISVNMVIAILIGLMVLIVVVAVVVGNIGRGGTDLQIQQCRTTNDADCDGMPDAIDPCPCPVAEGSTEGCRECSQYKECKPGPGC